MLDIIRREAPGNVQKTGKKFLQSSPIYNNNLQIYNRVFDYEQIHQNAWSKKTETRFAGYDEVKETEGKRDVANEEIFLRENQVPLDDLPLKELNQEWLKTHLPTLKSKNNRDVTVENYISNNSPKYQFWIT